MNGQRGLAVTTMMAMNLGQLVKAKTKTSTLELAVIYIRALQRGLSNKPFNIDCPGHFVPMSQSLIVWSRDAEARSRSSSEKATIPTTYKWPLRVPQDAPVLGSHSLAVLSQEGEARSRPSNENATRQTGSEWP